MPVWNIDPVEQRPEVHLRSWQIREVLRDPERTWSRHFFGYSVEDQQGQVCSAIVSWDPRAGRAVTASGRIYELVGRPGASQDAYYVWSVWRRHSNVVEERDVTQVVFAEMQAAKAGDG